MAGGFLVYWAMNIGPVFAQSLGCILCALEFLLSFTLPGGLVSGQPVKETDSNASAWEAIANGFSGTKEGVKDFGKLFSQNRQLGLLLSSLVLATIGIRQSGIRQQYATHRYGWSWAKVSTTHVLFTEPYTSYLCALAFSNNILTLFYSRLA